MEIALYCKELKRLHALPKACDLASGRCTVVASEGDGIDPQLCLEKAFVVQPL